MYLTSERSRSVSSILNKKAVSIIYTSLSSGSAARELVPHSIIDNGLRWHVRAYDRKSNSFRDFVLTRISKVTIKDDVPQNHEDKLEDHQWMRMMPLQLVPHPNNIKHATAIQMDYGMDPRNSRHLLCKLSADQWISAALDPRITVVSYASNTSPIK